MSEPHTHTHTPVGHWGGKGTAPRPIEVRSLRLYSRAQALAARSGSQFLRLRQTITARAIAHDSLRTSEKSPQSPIPFCAKLRPTEPPFLESTRMCKRARATRASGEAAAERLPPPAAPNPDFRSPTFAPFLFAPLFGERTEAPASGPCAPSAAPHQSFFPALPRGWAGARSWGGRRSQQPLRRRLFAFHAVAGLKGSGRDLSAVRLKLGVYPAAKMEGPLSVFGDRSTGEAIRSQNGKGGRGLGLADGGAVPLSQPARSGPAAAILALSPALPKRV